MFKNKKILITGGTGSLGSKLVEILLSEYYPNKIHIYSRSESTQVEMEKNFNDDRLNFILGDVYDYDRLSRVMEDVNIVIHAAALKHVSICERNPSEAINTNIIGTSNVIDTAINNNVERVIFVSSDKAVYPVAVYGATKLIGEKLIADGNNFSSNTLFSSVRFGNMIGSKGSVIPIFEKQKLDGKITITDGEMTRFWITLEQAAKFIIYCINHMNGSEIFIPKIPSTTIFDLAEAIAPNVEKITIGKKPGERLHEILLTMEESLNAKDCGKYFIMSNSSSNEDVLVEQKPFQYKSNSTKNLISVSDIKKLLNGTYYFNE